MNDHVKDILDILNIFYPGISWIIDGRNIGVTILINVDSRDYTQVIRIYEPDNAYILGWGLGYYTPIMPNLSDDIELIFGILGMFISIHGVLLIRTETGSFIPLTATKIPQKKPNHEHC